MTLKINEEGGKPHWIVPILGRRRMCKEDCKMGKNTLISCLDGSFTKLPYHRKEKMIKRLSSRNHRHRLIKLLNKRFLSTEAKISDFLELLTNYENCSYYNALSLLRSADIVILSYAYLDPPLLKRLTKLTKINREDLLILIDEAHNLANERFLEITKFELELIRNIYWNNPILDLCIKELRGVRILDPKILIRSKTEFQMFRKYLKDIRQYPIKVRLHYYGIPYETLNAYMLWEIIDMLDELIYKIQFIEKTNEYYLIVTPEKIMLYAPNYSKWLENIQSTDI